MSLIKSYVRVSFLLSILFIELLLLAAKLPEREFDFSRSANLVLAHPLNGGTVTERDIGKALTQWVAKHGRGKESPGQYVRILRDGKGLAFAAIRVVPEDE